MFSFLCLANSLKQVLPVRVEHRVKLDYRDRLARREDRCNDDCVECEWMFGGVAISLTTMTLMRDNLPLCRGTVLNCCSGGCFATEKPPPKIWFWRMGVTFDGSSHGDIDRRFRDPTLDPRVATISARECAFCEADEAAKCRCNCRFVVTPLAKLQKVPFFHGPLARCVESREHTFAESPLSCSATNCLPKLFVRLGFAYDHRVRSVRCTTCGFVPSCVDLFILFPNKHTLLNTRDMLDYELIRRRKPYNRRLGRMPDRCERRIGDLAVVGVYRGVLESMLEYSTRSGDCEACDIEKIRDGMSRLNDLHVQVRKQCPNTLHTARLLDEWYGATKCIPGLLMLRELGF